MMHHAMAQTSTAAVQEGNAHVVNTFRFEIAAPMAQVAPLFAPEAERRWAGEHWNPVFAYPQPGSDVQGAVWTIRHGDVDSVWVNTLFDVAGGRMQYVAVVGTQFTMTVDVRVTALQDRRTAVEVTYARTALDRGVNQRVIELGRHDRESGPEWQHGIETALGLQQK
ncbi:hypothetical protein FTW19_08585 [Terriglobus albidus]|uniref:ATPase n=1 Tax=Terriglobus albidus TaxID=1592106 RepID=A0A5B9E6Y1_9BACT|nr:hypothetical protein [Terriglobus albidus]QEE28042.1 hypothetical protein FTW19_08585 [Terriglobus albidus]